MLEKTNREKIIALIKREVVPAVGCTEPAAVSLAVAKATEMLGTLPSRIKVGLSGNMLKNAMGVGIPGTGMIGLPIAIALGALIGKSEYGLEVLKDVNSEWVEKGKTYIDEKRIEIYLVAETPSNLYIDVEVSDEIGNTAETVISGFHTNFVKISKNGADLYSGGENEENPAGNDEEETVRLNMKTVWDFATESPLEEIDFILEARTLNKAASELGLQKKYGHSLGATIKNSGTEYLGDSYLKKMITATSAACDARMGGAS